MADLNRVQADHQREPTAKFLAWAQQANESYSRRRAEYRAAYPIAAMEQLWKPQSVSELAEYLKRRPTGHYSPRRDVVSHDTRVLTSKGS